MFFCIFNQEDNKIKKVYSKRIEDINKQIKDKKVLELFESNTLAINDFLTYKTDNIENNLGI
jgi:cell fate (sporulation/competence/biofilm development) regulator YmcA (YheA/YmcA/DUF963 family)